MKRSCRRARDEARRQRLNPSRESLVNSFQIHLCMCSIQRSFETVYGRAPCAPLRKWKTRIATEGRARRRAHTRFHLLRSSAIFLIRKRNALSFIKPSASRWLYTVSRSNVANSSEYNEHGERRPTTVQLPL